MLKQTINVPNKILTRAIMRHLSTECLNYMSNQQIESFYSDLYDAVLHACNYLEETVTDDELEFWGSLKPNAR